MKLDDGWKISYLLNAYEVEIYYEISMETPDIMLYTYIIISKRGQRCTYKYVFLQFFFVFVYHSFSFDSFNGKF